MFSICYEWNGQTFILKEYPDGKGRFSQPAFLDEIFSIIKAEKITIMNKKRK